ncbi:MAG: riboflavin biosynthesis protein RibF [Lachnospiraceae bacterium]|nr:riboflavin biosynthesis protein RibF [Lachnospiraceae bacterium]
MEIITKTTDFYLREESAAAIGKFDGVHVGHRRLLEEILGQKKAGRKACVFTFDPPPSVFFRKTEEKELSTREEKRRLFAALGVDILIEFPLNRETAAMLPQTFVSEVLFGRMRAGFVAAGTDISFGAGGVGDAVLLKRMAAESGVDVRIIEKVAVDGQEVSSTRVRKAVEEGDMPLTEQLLGMAYPVFGTVQHGNRIGRTLGMPTLNLLPPADKLLPPLGVYYSGVWLNGQYYKAISNIGYKPTIKEDIKRLGVETYLYDFDGDVYGEEIEVNLYEFKRPEKQFHDVEELRTQLQEDITAGAAYSR